MSNRSGGERNSLRICLSGGAPEARRQIRAVLEGLGDPPVKVEESGVEDWSAGTPSMADHADIVMAVSSDAGEADWLERLTHLAGAAPRAPLIAVAPDRSPDAIRRIVQAGVDELLFVPIDPSEARRALLKLAAAQQHAARRGGGRVISIASLTGGAGVTTLAGNLATGLRRLGKGVALVDLDLQSGALTGFLNMNPERTLATLAGRERQLDSIQLEAALSKHPSGVYLLSAPERIEDCELVTDQTVSGVVGLMRELFDFVLVDCGGRIDENAVAAWERSDYVLYVLDQSIAAVRAALRFSNLFGRLGLRNIEPAYVLGRYQSRHSITERQIVDTLGKPMFARIPRDDTLFESAALRGEDLWTAGRGRAPARAIDDLSARLAGGAALRVANPRGLRGWLRAWMRRSAQGSAPAEIRTDCSTGAK